MIINPLTSYIQKTPSKRTPVHHSVMRSTNSTKASTLMLPAPFRRGNFSANQIISSIESNPKIPNTLKADLKIAYIHIENRFTSYSPVAILGGTSFYSENGQRFCEALGRELAKKQVILGTGGMDGVGKTVAQSFSQKSDAEGRLFQFLPSELSNTVSGIPKKEWEFGKTITLGQNWEERRKGLAKWSRLFIAIEGGPGTNHEINSALLNGAIVIPIQGFGGAASGRSFPEQEDTLHRQFEPKDAHTQLQRAGLLRQGDWFALQQNKSIDNLVKITSSIIDRAIQG